jgi:hypothetical protein
MEFPLAIDNLPALDFRTLRFSHLKPVGNQFDLVYGDRTLIPNLQRK